MSRWLWSFLLKTSIKLYLVGHCSNIAHVPLQFSRISRYSPFVHFHCCSSSRPTLSVECSRTRRERRTEPSRIYQTVPVWACNVPSLCYRTADKRPNRPSSFSAIKCKSHQSAVQTVSVQELCQIFSRQSTVFRVQMSESCRRRIAESLKALAWSPKMWRTWQRSIESQKLPNTSTLMCTLCWSHRNLGKSYCHSDACCQWNDWESNCSQCNCSCDKLSIHRRSSPPGSPHSKVKSTKVHQLRTPAHSRAKSMHTVDYIDSPNCTWMDRSALTVQTSHRQQSLCSRQNQLCDMTTWCQQSSSLDTTRRSRWWRVRQTSMLSCRTWWCPSSRDEVSSQDIHRETCHRLPPGP